MPTIYESLGVPTIINAKGPSTRVSGAVLAPEVAAAMGEASQHCVDMAVLQGRASEIIAEITGAEAGLATSGAAAGLLLGTAACVTGLDPGKMNRLPDTTGMKNQVIIPRSHRNFYDHAVRAAGVELVEVGISDRFSGAGVRDTEAWEIEDVITDATAAVHYVAQPYAAPPLPAVTEAAHRRGVPVLVDAAAQLPLLRTCGGSLPKAPTWWLLAAAKRLWGRRPPVFCAAAATSSPPQRSRTWTSTTTTSCGTRPPHL